MTLAYNIKINAISTFHLRSIYAHIYLCIYCIHSSFKCIQYYSMGHWDNKGILECFHLDTKIEVNILNKERIKV